MRLKLDENLGRQAVELFRAAGHEVATVLDQGMASSPDDELIVACRRERRCLVTLDLDFGNPLRFRPADYPGIAVLRLPAKPAPADLKAAAETLCGALEDLDVEGRLWVVQAGRVRIYQPPDDLDL